MCLLNASLYLKLLSQCSHSNTRWLDFLMRKRIVKVKTKITIHRYFEYNYCVFYRYYEQKCLLLGRFPAVLQFGTFCLYPSQILIRNIIMHCGSQMSPKLLFTGKPTIDRFLLRQQIQTMNRDISL